jgi:hypothetical protein
VLGVGRKKKCQNVGLKGRRISFVMPNIIIYIKVSVKELGK